ncbi:cell surface heme-binding protein Shp [Anaerostipes hadrus]|uniref:heme-binding Shp domain-containing protein n=1 Tax=Anaerostipes hadrus TaxID=649756 RepID=UPI001D01D401|nr:heme-binding Shp domain-containing protein [Anaerostipes hadrus]MCB5543756.1 cell surface heme-binding protein Shp [Anaerostipes hadrus]
MKKHIVQLKNWILILVVLLSFGGLSKDVKAASGNVYSCQIARTYEHPVTGKVEDSGGSSSKATGQGMVEGAISSKGLLEVTDSGDYYLTFRISLVDYTSDLSFSVQKRGASGFQTQSVTQTATGKDNNGTTKDLRIKLSSQDSIIRCSMYVKPMGRNVIFYFYPGNYTTGNSVGMKALMVTTSSSDTQTSNNNQAQTTASAGSETQTTADTQSSDDSLSNAQGLSLSTAPKTTTKKKTSSEKSVGTWILILTVSMTLSGLVLFGVAAAIVYYYRKNWDKWGGDQDEYDEIYNDEN